MNKQYTWKQDDFHMHGMFAMRRILISVGMTFEVVKGTGFLYSLRIYNPRRAS